MQLRKATALLLSLAMLLGMLPVSAASPAPARPAPVQPGSDKVVYLKTDGSDENDGTAADRALATLGVAYEKLPAQGGTVVVCGEYSLGAYTISPDTVAYGGRVLITGDDGKGQTGGSITFPQKCDIVLGDQTAFDDITLTAGAAVSFYHNSAFAFGEHVTTNVTDKKFFRTYAGNLDSTAFSKDIEVTLYSGTVNQVLLGSTKHDIGNAACFLGGTARITSSVKAGGAKHNAGDIDITVDGEDVEINVVFVTPNDAAAAAGNVSLRLNRGTINDAQGTRAVENNQGIVQGDVSVEISPQFHIDRAYGPLRTTKTGEIKGTRSLTLPGWDKALPDTMLDNYDVIHLTEGAQTSYAGKLTGKTLDAAAGTAIKLEAYESAAAAAGDGVTVTGEGSVTYSGGGQGEVTYLDTVYLSGTVASSGDGTAPDKAVKTFAEAYDKLDKAKGGTVVLCGNYTLTESVETDHTGLITITGSYGGTDYAPTLTIDNAKARDLVFGDQTVVEHIALVGTATATVTISSRRSLTMGEGVTTQPGASFVVRGGHKKLDYSTTDISITLLGGTYHNVLLHQNNTSVGNVTYRHGGSAYVSSNVSLGGQNGSTGDIDFTMTGGYIKVIYDTPRKSGRVGDVTLRLEGGGIVELRDYNQFSEKAPGTMGDITVYLGPEFSYSGAIGAWTDGYLTTGTKTLVVTDYAGTTPPSLGCYDVVDFVGAHTVPDGFEITPAVAAPDHLLQIAGYQGDMTMALDSFTALNVAKSSDVMYLGTYPGALPLTVEALSAFRLSSITNTALPPHTGEGTVELVTPQWSAPEKILSVDFDGGDAADGSGKGNHGAVTGDVAYEESYDGTKAIYFHNTYGPQAQQYVLFKDLKGLDLATDSYTVSFWACMDNGGADTWNGSGNAVASGADLIMENHSVGGMVFSNTDSRTGAVPGFSAAQLHQAQFLTLAMTGQDGAQRMSDGSRELVETIWHHLTISVDRGGYYRLYIDGALKAAVRISDLEGQALGLNTLGLGADALGQYGIGTAWIDDFTVYSGALGLVDAQALYYTGALRATIHETGRRIATAGEEYPAPAVQAITEKLAQVKAAAGALTEADYPQAIVLEQELRGALEDFLDSSIENARTALILISDIHISTTTDARADSLRQLFADRREAGIEIDGILQAGDFADNSSPATSENAFDVMDEVLAEDPSWQHIGSTGNHEQQYTTAEANYMASSAVYWARMQRYISNDSAVRQQGAATLDGYHAYTATDKDGNTFTGAPCFGMTLKGYHYLVLNSDNPGQYADAKSVDQNDEAASNAADPIRHGVWFSDETLEWMETMLTRYEKDGKPIFVVCHYPFTDSVPLSYFSPIPIKDNSIGKQDARIRSILASHKQVFYFSGHLHSAMGAGNFATVTAEEGGSFTLINLPSLKGSSRGYTPIPATWYMFVYDNEIVLRGRDAANGKWVTQYDMILPLVGELSGEIAINGEVKVGETLTADLSGMVPANAQVDLTWSREGTAVGTGERYTLTQADAGHAITLTVTGTGFYSGALTAQSAIVSSGYTPPYPGAVRPSEPSPTEPEPDEPTDPGQDAPLSGYVDLPTGWSRASVEYVIGRELMVGVDATHFAPELTMSRAMAVTVLYRISGEPAVGTYAGWSDVAPGSWFEAPIAWATKNGYASGRDALRFAPDEVITREEMVVLFYRWAAATGRDSGKRADLSVFTDAPRIAPSALEAFRWAVAAGVVNGTSGSTLDPSGSLTREQLAAVLRRMGV